MPKTLADEIAATRPDDSLEHDLDVSRERLARLSAQRKLHDAVGRIRSLEAQVESLLAMQGKVATQRFERARKRRNARTSVIAVASDWHIEEPVEPETVGGLNSYDLQEAERRVKRFFAKTVELLEFSRHLAPVGEIVLALLGDLISGYIHEELLENNQLSPTETCLLLRELIHSGIEFLLRETKLPILIPTSHGNHGRTVQKPRVSTSYANSYEWMLYQVMARDWSKDHRVRWAVGQGLLNTVLIQGRRVRFQHGDAIRYSGGVGGITIPVNKAIAQWDKAERADLTVFGHYHQFLAHWPHWVANGCLIGYGPFAQRIKAEYQPPTQSFLVVDREMGVTLAMPMFVKE